jgi:hypothetical protein
MSFKNRCTVTCSYDFEAHLQRVQKKSHYSKTVLQWFVVVPGWLLVLPGVPRHAIGTPKLVVSASNLGVGTTNLGVGAPNLGVIAPRLVASAHSCSQEHPKFSPALWGDLKLITVTLMVHLCQSSEIPVTPKPGRNALLGSDTLLKLTHLSLHSASSQILLEASSD